MSFSNHNSTNVNNKKKGINASKNDFLLETRTDCEHSCIGHRVVMRWGFSHVLIILTLGCHNKKKYFVYIYKLTTWSFTQLLAVLSKYLSIKWLLLQNNFSVSRYVLHPHSRIVKLLWDRGIKKFPEPTCPKRSRYENVKNEKNIEIFSLFFSYYVHFGLVLSYIQHNVKN